MMPAEALAIATREGRALHYAHETAEAIDVLGGDPFPWMTIEEMCREHRGICRDIALWTLDRALRLCPAGAFALIVGDTEDPDTLPDHAWCEVRDDDDVTWSDPTRSADVHAMGWYGRYTPTRAYRLAIDPSDDRTKATAREDFRRVT